jgi:uncharacterized protein DUF2851
VNNLSEKEIQKAVFQIFSDPARIWHSTEGERLQVLSPGRHNVHEGPDFRETALLVNGLVYVGDAEFHRYSSEWLEHHHQNDTRYENTILHVVCDCDNPNLGLRTLIIDKNEIESALQESKKQPKKKFDLSSLEELQHFALIRLMRKASEARAIYNRKDLKSGLREIAFQFLRRYNSKRKRPVYTEFDLSVILDRINSSHIYSFLEMIENDQKFEIAGEIYSLLKTKISTEGSHLRREIILNCVLPMALCFAREEARIDLFLWYWSTPALQSYGILKRKFPEFDQKFLWQQQGMLEYMKEYGRKPRAVGEKFSQYGFGELLEFYRMSY